MKVIHAFSQIFAIFSFLTLGSLMLIVAMHILTVDIAVLKLREIYHSPWQSLRTGFVGMLFMMLGLHFSKMLVKQGRQSDALILRSENGPLVVSVTAIEDVIRKAVKRFHLVKAYKSKIWIGTKKLQANLRLVLWSGGRVPDLLIELQEEIKARLEKLLGDEVQLELVCDVQKIEDHEAEPSVDHAEAVLIH
ncbi:MAG: alkaline shock response membrane anchor protein AmaP [Candidatus Omnitrophota bacterium]|jgi:hypothetical protein